MAKVKLNLKGLSIPEKVDKIRQIVKALTGNPDFPNPQPPLATLTAFAAALEADYNDAQASKQATTMKLSKMRETEDGAERALRQLAGYVESVAGDEETKILSAGMSLRSAASAPSVSTAPAGLTATEGDHDGEIDLSHDPVPNAKSYEIQRSADPPTATSWVHEMVSVKSSATVSGLVSGTRYWFRVRAVTSAGPSGWSDPSTKIAP